MRRLVRQSYGRLPLPFRRLLCRLPYALLAGHLYRETLQLCRRLDVMPRNDVVILQEARLRALLEFAVQEVPFYEPLRKVVHQLSPCAALREFPLLSKEDVQRNNENLISRSARRIAHQERTTGGSSGNQLRFLEDDSTYAREMGFMHSQWARVGYTPKSRKATFRGTAFRNITDTCFWQYNPVHNELQFSPFHLNEKNLALYVRMLVKYQPAYLHGYPSAIGVLAEYVIRHQLTAQLPPINATLLASEGCSDDQRKRIESAFNTRVYTFYGHSERTVLGGECECNRTYHAFPAYGVLEIIGNDGQPCDIGEQGEIVGTGFLNRAMPLIRYRTDDYATKLPPQCECGRCWDRFSNVLSRRSLEGFVVGQNGSRIGVAALNMHGDLFKNVVRYQYYQRVPGQLVVRVIPNSMYSLADEVEIVTAHRQKLWGEMDVIVQKVQDIPMTGSGKQRRVISEIE